MAEQTNVMTPERAWFVDILSSVKVTVRDPSVIALCIENHDETGTPQPFERNGTGWRNTYYDLDSEDDVLQHLAYNCAVNDVERANRLDGWGDLADDAATMKFERHVEYERIVPVEG